MDIKFNLQPKASGVGSFTPPKGYEKVDGEWVKKDSDDSKVRENESLDASEASEK